MQWIVDITAPHWIVMHVFEFLQHHLIVFNLFWMAPLLPELIFLIDLVTKFEVAQFVQQSAVSRVFQLVNDPSRRIRLEALNLIREIVARCDPVQVVLHNHITKDQHSSLSLKELPRVKDYLGQVWAGKDR